jgi:hypothetical protein
MLGKPEPAINPSTKILCIDSSITNANLILSHNSSVIALLQQREATDAQLFASSEEELRQLRNIYIAIIAVLLPMIFIGRTKEDEKNRFDIAGIASLITLVLIPSFLYVNSDIEERLTRSDDANKITHRSLESLINSSQLSTLWYRVDYTNRNNQLEHIAHPLMRKFRRAARPMPETLIFYWLPWIIVFHFHCNSNRNKNAG